MDWFDGSLLASRYLPEVPNFGEWDFWVCPPGERCLWLSRSPCWGAPRGFRVAIFPLCYRTSWFWVPGVISCLTDESIIPPKRKKETKTLHSFYADISIT